MNLGNGGHLAIEKPAPDVWVVRFTKPDAGKELYDVEPITDAELYLELRTTVLSVLSEGETVVLNLALVESFGSPFYRLLLKVREEVMARKGRIILCRPSPLVLECFDLFQASRVFEITSTEAGAIRRSGALRAPEA